MKSAMEKPIEKPTMQREDETNPRLAQKCQPETRVAMRRSKLHTGNGAVNHQDTTHGLPSNTTAKVEQDEQRSAMCSLHSTGHGR